ncbi:MAG: heavy-metal-associated domain-containing protein [Prolixibacteraceae bacterium]|jgi:copper chaperone CopZ|nr:heavy-metal-associated domain-containing protein [Prolixibacteraceae bacterium]
MNYKLLLTGMLALFFATSPAGAQKVKSDTVCFKSNMHCAACEKTVFENLRFEKGVKDLKVDHVSNTIRVVYAPGKNSSESLAGAVEKLGYEATEISADEYGTLVKAGEKKPATSAGQPH